jgi:hypothetical protein
MSRDVTGILGSQVEHSTESIGDSDAAKRERQQNAINLMKQADWKGSPSEVVSSKFVLLNKGPGMVDWFV